MGLFDLFKKWPEPLQRYEDEVLGPMAWSADDEAWEGEYGGIKYTIQYGREAAPTSELLAYARAVLTAPDRLNGSFQDARAAALAEYPAYADEIAALRIDAMRFYVHKTTRRILADLAGGKSDRSWRMEFLDNDCEGIGFDT